MMVSRGKKDKLLRIFLLILTVAVFFSLNFSSSDAKFSGKVAEISVEEQIPVKNYQEFEYPSSLPDLDKDFKSFPAGVKIESAIYDALKGVEGRRVRVIIDLKKQFFEISDLKKVSKKIKKQQDKVLSYLGNDFAPIYRYKTFNSMAGYVNSDAIRRLEKLPAIEKVYLDRISKISLAEATPLVNAPQIHNLGFDGQGQTICILDTGIDYKHENLGNANCQINVGNTEPVLVESPHDYPNNHDQTWVIQKPGYSEIAVHFERIDLEKEHDFVYIKDGQGNVVQALTGGDSWPPYKGADIWSAFVSGDTIQINLVSDSSKTGWGFRIDSVMNGLPEFSNCGRVIGGYDYVNNDFDPMDDNGHGTNIAGAAASDNPTYTGVAPKANIVANKVCDSAGGCLDSNWLAGIDNCIGNKDNYGISIISMSFGRGSFNDPFFSCDPFAVPLSRSLQVGIFNSIASGNGASTNGINFPACSSWAVSIGATYDIDIVGTKDWGVCSDSDPVVDQITCFTNRAGILDLLAPDVIITSTKNGGGFVDKSGTSMSTAMVSGAAAVLKQLAPSLSPMEIRDVLKRTGKPVVDPVSGLTFHRIDLLAAVQEIGILILPNNFRIFRGFLISGGIEDLFASDDSYLNVKAGLTLYAGEPPAQIEFFAEAPANSVSEFTFSIESAVSTPGLEQRIELFNYITGAYELVDTRQATTSDSVVEIVISNNPNRFINSDREMKAKIIFKATGLTLMWPWTVRIDHAAWKIIP